jgi:hypothetical protein
MLMHLICHLTEHIAVPALQDILCSRGSSVRQALCGHAVGTCKWGKAKTSLGPLHVYNCCAYQHQAHCHNVQGLQLLKLQAYMPIKCLGSGIEMMYTLLLTAARKLHTCKLQDTSPCASEHRSSVSHQSSAKLSSEKSPRTPSSA